jgi:uncharacterized protein
MDGGCRRTGPPAGLSSIPPAQVFDKSEWGFYNLQVVMGARRRVGPHPTTGRIYHMAHSHKIDITGLLGGGRQLMLLDDEVAIEEFEGISFLSPARVHLELRYVDRMLHLVGTVDARARGACDSCLEEVDVPVHADIDERLDPDVNRDDDPFGESNVLTGNRLDVADLAQQLVLSEMPMGLRCSDDCAGLCGACGANKNTSPCSCDSGTQTAEPDGGAQA